MPMKHAPGEGRVLLCGARKDIHLKWVVEEIVDLGGEVEILDLLEGDTFVDRITPESRTISISGLDLAHYRSVWNRLKIKLDPVFSNNSDRAKYFFEKEALHQYRGLFEVCEEKGLFVANSGRAGYRAFHKPYQLGVARDCRLNVPETLATNQLNEAVAFAERFGEIAVKVYDSAFIKGEGEEPNRYIFTSRLTPGKLRAIGQDRFSGSVSQLQQYLSKRFELRVVCGGDFCHVIKIDSQAIDASETD
jgi:hypothetical protein